MNEAYAIISENFLTLTSPLPSALGSSEYSECFIKNQIRSNIKVMKMPRTSILNLNLVIKSVLNIIYKATVQIVKLKKSGLINMTKIVRIV
jgi:hypothetical protein